MLLRGLTFPFNGRCSSLVSAGQPAHLREDSQAEVPLSSQQYSLPLSASVALRRGEHQIKLQESAFRGKKETTRLRFSSKLNFPLMGLKKRTAWWLCRRTGLGPNEPRCQAGWWQERPPVSAGKLPSPCGHFQPQAYQRCCSDPTQYPGPPGAPPTCGDVISPWQGPEHSSHHH